MGSADGPSRQAKSFPGRLDQLAGIGEFVGECARRLGLGERDIFAIQMAVDEAATNIIVHGYGEDLHGSIDIACWNEGGDFVVEMRDHGRPFDAADVPEPDLQAPLEERTEGGLGIFLMRRMMDHIAFARRGEENVLTMVRHHVAAPAPPAGLAIVSPSGRIDATTSPQLERMLREPLETGQRLLLVDLSRVTYMSSTGLRLLLIAAKQLRQRQGRLLLCCPQPPVERVLLLTGLAGILPLYRTREAALNALEHAGDPRLPQ